VRVCILDSGVDPNHPKVGEVQGAVEITVDEEGNPVASPDEEGDLCGHGTACAGVIRQLAPECEIHSVRVLGAGYTGSGPILLGGLRWAVEQGFDVVNMSLSTTKRQFAEVLHELADKAYFNRTILVASAHNMPVESYPWRFASVISVGSHEEEDPFVFYANPDPPVEFFARGVDVSVGGHEVDGQREFYVNADPPVEFFARGVDVEVAWPGEGVIRATGNSFAAPHIAGMCALILAKHPELTPFELKSVLAQIASTAGGNDG